MIHTNPASKERYDKITDQHGGFWRHNIVDHNYLYNLYFPPAEFFAHLSERIHQLVLNYPVAQRDLAGLLGELINKPADSVVVGNGAAEIIKILGRMGDRMIVPVPSFNEYINASEAKNVVEFALDPPGFELDVEAFVAEAIRHQAKIAVVVSPNNPTSLLVEKEQLLALLDKLAGHDCMLIVDESFIDFVEQSDNVSLAMDYKQHPNLAILKSMSKAYGICGIRIGYLLTVNQRFLDRVRQGLHIWNVNGFAEEFLRLAPRYHQEFVDSCGQVKKDRDRFYSQLQTLPGMRVYKPSANYVFCRLPEQSDPGPVVTEKLFVEHSIYVKHCQGKEMPASDRYLRIASRTQEENSNLVAALGNVLGSESN